MDEEQVAPLEGDNTPDADESPSGEGEQPSSSAPNNLPDAQELRNRLAAMGRETAQQRQRADQLEQQLANVTSYMSQQAQQSYQQQEREELERIARLPVTEQALARAERAERKLNEFQAAQQNQAQRQQEAQAAQAEARRLLKLANETYGIEGTDQEIKADQLPDHAWSSRDAYIATLATLGEQRKSGVVTVAKQKVQKPAEGNDIQAEIQKGVQAVLDSMGVSGSNSAKPVRQQAVRDDAIQTAVARKANNVNFRNEGPIARQKQLKEIREQLAQRVK